ncbi:MAG: sensor histidine kinase, partial [Bacteroidia bacterium]
MRSKRSLQIGMMLVTAYLILAVIWWTWSLIAYGQKTVALEQSWLNRDLAHVETRLELLLRTQAYPGQDAVQWKNSTYTCHTAQLLGDLNDNEHHLRVQADDQGRLSIQGFQEEIQNIEQRKKSNKTKWLAEGMTLGALLIGILIVLWSNLNNILRLNQQQTNFLLAVTHELKTPIAAAKLAIETALKRPEKEVNERMLVLSKQNMNRLAKTMDKVLLATRIENKVFAIEREWIAVSDVINEALNQAQVNPESLQNLSVDVPSNLYVFGEMNMLATAIQNLISNSIKYSEENCVIINIESKLGNDFGFIWVKDQGYGIAGSERKMVVKKFYRVGDEHTRAQQGTGLGLYLVNQIARLHGAKLLIEDHQPRGTSIGLA